MRLIDYEGLKAKGFKYSRAHIWRLIKAGQFPKPLKRHGASRNLWVDDEIDNFIQSLIAERDGEDAA
jgi:prophage regulatory protein